MAGKADKPKEAIESKVAIINCGIKSVQVYGTGDSEVRYRVTFDTMFDAIKKEGDDYVAAQVDYIDFVPRVLIAQSINCVAGLDTMYTKKKEAGLRNDSNSGFGAAELQVVLRGAKLDVERTKFVKGDEYTDNAGVVHTHENDGYNTNITKIKVSDKVQGKLDAMFDSIFDF